MNSEFLNDILECSVCLKPLDDQNKVLPCQHTFCKSCLLSIVKSHKELRCPECRVVVQQRVEDLPSNILLIRLLDGIRFQQKQYQIAESNAVTDTRRHSTDGILTESPLLNDCNLNKISSKPLYLHEHAKSDPAVTKALQQVRISSLKPYAIALYTYKSDEQSDLSFEKGDTIRLLKKVDQNWMSGEYNGATGLFPVNYVKIMQPLPSDRPYCTALYDFEEDPNAPDKDCLHFVKEDRILVIRKVDENWAEGLLRDKIGIFPLLFVKMDDESRKMLDDVSSSSDETKPHRSGGVSAAARRLTSKQSGKNTKKRHSFPVFNTAKSKDETSTSSYRHSVELGDSSLTLAPSDGESSRAEASTVDTGVRIAARREIPPSVASQNTSEATKTKQVIKPSARSKSNEQLDSNSHESTSKSPVSKVVVAAFSYKTQKQDELDLIKGDSYLITEVCRDGWCRGSHVISGRSGVFPGNYITPKPVLTSGNARPFSLVQPRDPATFHASDQMTSRTYEDFLNLQASKNDKSKSSSHKLPLSARLPSSASSRSKILVPGSKPGSTSGVSPERKRSTSARTSSTTTSSLDLNQNSKSPPPKPLPPSTSSGIRKYHKSSQPPLQHSLSLEDKSATTSSSSHRSKQSNVEERYKTALKEKKRDKGGGQSSLIKFLSEFSKSSSRSSSSSSSTPPSNHRQSASKPSIKPLPRDRYIVTMNYPTDDPEELELREGDLVIVHSRQSDGWFKGTNPSNGRSGHFPSTFVEKISRS